MKIFAILLLALVAGACTYSPERGGYGYRSDRNYGEPGQNKVLICHKGKKTLELPESAVSAHLGHGDRRGRC